MFRLLLYLFVGFGIISNCLQGLVIIMLNEREQQFSDICLKMPSQITASNIRRKPRLLTQFTLQTYKDFCCENVYKDILLEFT